MAGAGFALGVVIIVGGVAVVFRSGDGLWFYLGTPLLALLPALGLWRTRNSYWRAFALGLAVAWLLGMALILYDDSTSEPSIQMAGWWQVAFGTQPPAPVTG